METYSWLSAGGSLANFLEHICMYGGQPPRLADTLNIPLKRAKVIYDRFWDVNVGLGRLKRYLEWYHKKHGFIRTIDGRPIYARKVGDLINYLFQSTGTILMKQSVILLDDWVKQTNLNGFKILDYHDEGAYDCSEEDAPQIARLAEMSVRKAGEMFNLNVPLIAKAKLGRSWKDVH